MQYHSTATSNLTPPDPSSDQTTVKLNILKCVLISIITKAKLLQLSERKPNRPFRH